MTTRSLLLYLPALPMKPEALLPKRRLASLAAALVATGHKPEVWDFGVPETLGEWYDAPMACAARACLEAEPGAPRFLSGAQPLLTARRFEHTAKERLRQWNARIAEKICATRSVDFVIFLIQDRKELATVLPVAQAVRKESPSIRIALAGEYVDYFGPALLASWRCIDAALAGEPESAVVLFAETLGSIGEQHVMPSLLMQGHSGRVGEARPKVPNLEELPVPLYEEQAVYPALRGGQFRLLSLEHSRGASGAANYLPQAPWLPQRVRVCAPAAFKAQVRHLQSTLPDTVFHFEGKHTPITAVHALAAELASGDPLFYTREGDMCALNGSTVAALSVSGCMSVGFRVLTGSQRLLEDFYGEKLTVTGIEQAFRAAHEGGLPAALHLVYPCPEDDRHTVEESLRLVSRCSPATVRLSLPQVLPGSAWRQYSADYGFKLSERRYLSRAASPCAALVGRYDPVYGMRGWNVRDIVTAWRRFETVADDLRVGVGLGERELLIAQFAADEEHYGAFWRGFERSLFLGDIDGVTAVVDTFNERVRAATRRETRTATLLRAVTAN